MKKSNSGMMISTMLFMLLSVTFVYGQEQGTASAAQTKEAAPSIRFSGIRFDAGTVKEGAIVNHDFEFTNEGQAVLRIRDVIPA